MMGDLLDRIAGYFAAGLLALMVVGGALVAVYMVLFVIMKVFSVGYGEAILVSILMGSITTAIGFFTLRILDGTEEKA